MEAILVTTFLFFLGAAIGSHLNVLIDRIPRGENVFVSRSYCENCKRKLVWFELIPVLSYIALKGKCRTCSDKIPERIIIVEMFTGLMFVVAYWINMYSLSTLLPFLVFKLLVISLLIAIFFIDLEHMIIPDVFTILLIAAAAIMRFLQAPALLPEFLIAGIASSLFFLLLFLITRGKGMGFGDVKFSFFIGLLFGYPGTILALYVAFLTGAVIGIILIMSGRKRLHGGTIPFGPFLIFGIFITLIWGDKIVQLIPLLH